MRTVGLTMVAALVALSTGCQSAPPQSAAPVAVVSGPSWAPAPVTVGGVSAVATTSGQTFALHTRSGDVTFVPGINLGATTPGHYPGEVAIEAADYHRWFAQMGAFGIRAVRIYTIHRPAFYTELLAYNRAHPDAPLYVVQGVTPPDETYTTTRDLYAAGPTAAFDAEIRDAVAAVTGRLRRDPVRGRADGSWTADVSPYVISWIVGAEMDPPALRASDATNAKRPAFAGRYFTSAAEATPTERWLTARVDSLATAVTATGRVAPVAFVNWPTTDPLHHPGEPDAVEDLVGLDANHLQPTSAWRGGYFASYHAYPYYPDFQRHDPAYQKVTYAGRTDPYAGYLTALRGHHATMPTMITEFGVPSSIGSSHSAPLGRDQGDHDEREAMATDAQLLREIKALGLAGGFVFEWTDEWFKFAWNTKPRQLPVDRRALTHDPWTNEQWFGVVGSDALGRSATTRVASAPATGSVEMSHDQSWVYATVTTTRPHAPLQLAFDVIPAAGEPATLPDGTTASGGSDVALVADARGVRQYVRSDQDGRLLDRSGLRSPAPTRWTLEALTTNRPLRVPTTGRAYPEEHLSVGELREGDWTPGRAGSDSRAQYHRSPDGRTLSLRLPWASLLVSDPSSRAALVIGSAGTTTTTAVPALTVRAVTDAGQVSGSWTWDTWNRSLSAERLKDGAGDLAAAFRDTALTPLG